MFHMIGYGEEHTLTQLNFNSFVLSGAKASGMALKVKIHWQGFTFLLGSGAPRWPNNRSCVAELVFCGLVTT